jgi:hypothetical protein
MFTVRLAGAAQRLFVWRISSGLCLYGLYVSCLYSLYVSCFHCLYGLSHQVLCLYKQYASSHDVLCS